MKANTPTATETFRMSVARLLNSVLMFPSIPLPTKKESSELSNSPRRQRVKGANDQRHTQSPDQASRDRPGERAANVPFSVLTRRATKTSRLQPATTLVGRSVHGGRTFRRRSGGALC